MLGPLRKFIAPSLAVIMGFGGGGLGVAVGGKTVGAFVCKYVICSTNEATSLRNNTTSAEGAAADDDLTTGADKG